VNSFSQFDLSGPLLKALAAEGYLEPTAIQRGAIPELLRGRDLLGIAQTGTGKTAAFALPMLELLSRRPSRPDPRTCRALVLAPTRELAAQIAESFRTYGRFLKLDTAVVFGGVGIAPQLRALAAGVDILVATPGRLVDLIERRALGLGRLETFVLDEVDQMLDLGFIQAIRRIVALLPKHRQNLFFSATMPKEISGLADALLKDPARVEIAPVATTVEQVVQRVIHAEGSQKLALLAGLLAEAAVERTLVFTRTKHGADKVVRGLEKLGRQAAAIHGNKSQRNRERALGDFRSGKIPVLVATDIAARGIDIDAVSHVINYDLPHVPESYVHRIGRTARAGAPGTAIAFCTPEERPLLRAIEGAIRMKVEVMERKLSLSAPAYGKRLPPAPSLKQQHRRATPVRFRSYGDRQRENRGLASAQKNGGESRQSWMRDLARRHLPAAQ
jgi:ATP-dependent RNA helicase RhlE